MCDFVFAFGQAVQQAVCSGLRCVQAAASERPVAASRGGAGAGSLRGRSAERVSAAKNRTVVVTEKVAEPKRSTLVADEL